MESEDKADKAGRFGCGFVLGLIVAAPLALGMITFSNNARIATILFVALAFGLGALRFRDSFWRWFSNWFGWFR